MNDRFRYSITAFSIDSADLIRATNAVNATAVVVYIYLVRAAAGQSTCTEFITDIADVTGYGQRTVQRAIADLKEAGLITVEALTTTIGKRTASRYTIVRQQEPRAASVASPAVSLQQRTIRAVEVATDKLAALQAAWLEVFAENLPISTAQQLSDQYGAAETVRAAIRVVGFYDTITSPIGAVVAALKKYPRKNVQQHTPPTNPSGYSSRTAWQDVSSLEAGTIGIDTGFYLEDDEGDE